MFREAPDLRNSDVLSSPHGGPTAWQECGCLFSFYPPSPRKAKRTSVGYSNVDGTRSSHEELASLSADALTRSQGEMALSWQRGQVCRFDDAGGDQ